ncbi:hypothetical protein HQ520_06560 [bacterium]|nr:hypothetical protein [bacterium]
MPYRGKRRWGFLLTAILAVALAGTGFALTLHSDPLPQATTPYTLGFSQITAGASSGQSLNYAVEDTIKMTAADETTQESGAYTVVNVLAEFAPVQPGLPGAAADDAHWNAY